MTIKLGGTISLARLVQNLLHRVGFTASIITVISVPVEWVIVWSHITAQALHKRVHCLVHRQLVYMPSMVTCRDIYHM